MDTLLGCLKCADIVASGSASGKCHKHPDGSWNCGGPHFEPDERLAPDPGSSDADHAALVTYLLSAVRRKDWHAVSDAASDLRVLEAKRG